jgi:hypothetical protein
MVPSDPQISSFSRRHARREHGIRKRQKLSPLLPETAFIPSRISAPEVLRVALPVEAGVSERPFATLQRVLACADFRGRLKRS